MEEKELNCTPPKSPELCQKEFLCNFHLSFGVAVSLSTRCLREKQDDLFYRHQFSSKGHRIRMS